MSMVRGRHDDENLPLMMGQERREGDAGDADGHDDVHDDVQRGRGPSDAQPHPDAPLDSDGTLRVEQDGDAPTPRFVQDENAWKRWRWIPYPARRLIRAVAKWSAGPPDPRPYRIEPFFPAVQHYPLRLVERFLPRRSQRFWLLWLYFSAWLITFVLVKRRGTVATEIANWGQPQTIGCGSSYWGAGNACGLDGAECRPFNNSGFAFRCSANCLSYMALNPRAVGDQEVLYQPLVVGGPPNEVQPDLATYRGDSYICAAAIHAGVITNQNGGCGVVNLVGRQQAFVSSQHNGLSSVGFDSYFPLSYRFVPGVGCSSQDSRWSLLAVSVVFTAVLSLFTASPALFFFPVFIGLFWTVGAALDPPPHGNDAALFSNVIGKFLPAMFVAWAMYDKMGVGRTLKDLTAQVEKTILWLGACWVGAMSNYTFDFIPIQRLNKHDLDQQPGAKAALSIIIVVLVAIVATQVWFFRKEARLIKYLGLYALLVAGIIIALVLPAQNLRLHHYIIALLLLPGTSLQTRPSLLYQGLLIGLFINGIARWGFDPVLQTSGALLGDAQKGSLLPTLRAPVINLGNATSPLSSIAFAWEAPPEGGLYDGVSVLVNDVERFRTYFGDAGEKKEFAWSRNLTLDLPEYFRFAFMSGSESGDYTKAGTWTADGQWREMRPGPSKVRRAGQGPRA
ncbi:hypothetical protein G6O67_003822 [Ophiocordyceps sinensis]|uniref:LCCL domain-containing protein n=2 Tax=Ophiocordyceps sinensis TaxID=72228 RepID=A0A8H4PSL2_9HYPO|nr:LCCL domain containing protein [Ophiocordyceps sinensis CO18]KAF4509678.1 hypothetical protein G6O67_003822 [Ophiocordyceps sinensis]